MNIAAFVVVYYDDIIIAMEFKKNVYNKMFKHYF